MDNKIVLIWFGICYALMVFTVRKGVDGATIIEKRTPTSDRLPEDYPDYESDVKYDDYPMLVPRKRAALLVDRLMIALQKAIEEEEDTREFDGVLGKNKGYADDAVREMDLQRRGHGSLSGQQKGRVYWRCYFNAVTCF